MVAGSAGVNQALVYRYFGSKEALLLEAVGPRESPFAQVLAEAPADELAGLIVGRLFGTTGREEMRKLGLMVAASNDEMVRELVRNVIDSSFGESLGARLEGDDARLRAEMVAAVVIGFGFLRTRIRTPALASAREEDLARLLTEVLDSLIDGDTPRP